MAEITSCPSCHRKLQVPETLIGQDVQCPTCGATFQARGLGGEGPSPSPSRQPPPLPADNWDSDRARPDDRPDFRRRRYEDDDDDTDFRRPRRDLGPHRGALMLTLGIVGLFVPVLGLVAWVLGHGDMGEIRAGRMDPDGEGLTQAGRILGIIGTVYWSLFLCCCGLSFLSAIGTRFR